MMHAPAAERMAAFHSRFHAARAQIRRVIVGNDDVVEGIITCLLGSGHGLLEGIPGVGKTRLVQACADALHLKFARIQFTPDLMPGDILGGNLGRSYRQRTEVTTLIVERLPLTAKLAGFSFLLSLLIALQDLERLLDGLRPGDGGIVEVLSDDQFLADGVLVVPVGPAEDFLGGVGDGMNR